jgi:peptidoglycan L-alanyl-D-glutamate endopeptidase CwlK
VILDARSERNLQGVHPSLVKVVRRAAEITEVPFIVIEGLRTPERQRELVAKGKSQTRNSRHLTGHAVDVMEAGGTWPFALYKRIAIAFKTAAVELGVPIVWGGDWKTLVDGPHFELDRSAFP